MFLYDFRAHPPGETVLVHAIFFKPAVSADTAIVTCSAVLWAANKAMGNPILEWTYGPHLQAQGPLLGASALKFRSHFLRGLAFLS